MYISHGEDPPVQEPSLIDKITDAVIDVGRSHFVKKEDTTAPPASSGIPFTTIALIGVGGFLAYKFLIKKK